MILNKKYQDDMDNSRVLVPVSADANGRDARCKVYFDGIMCGFANAPIKMFSDNEGFKRVFYRLMPDNPVREESFERR